MNIQFDAFIIFPFLKENLSIEEEIFYSEFLKFIEQRLHPLKDIIDGIEKVNPKSYVCINFLYQEEDILTPVDYPASLAEKMLNCFSAEDIAYMCKVIERRLDTFDNGN